MRSRLRVLWSQLKHPGKLFAYLRLRLAYRLRLRRVPVLPVTLDVEPNNDCNFSCPHCQVTHWAKQRKHLEAKSFERLLGQFPRLARIKLQGMGEPLLNRQLPEMLRMGEARGITMTFFTNGAVMSPAVAEQLAALKNAGITFSVDGATKETFEAIRVGGDFQKVKANLRRLVELRGARKEPEIHVWAVATRRNVTELVGIVRLAAELGADGITIQLFLTDWGKPEMRERNDRARVAPDDPALRAALQEADRASRESGIPLTVFRENFLSKRRPCPWPWTSAYVAGNGDVVPCCILADSDTVKMGNVFERDFSEIWNSPAYLEFRRRIAKHDLPDYCKGCYGEK